VIDAARDLEPSKRKKRLGAVTQEVAKKAILFHNKKEHENRSETLSPTPERDNKEKPGVLFGGGDAPSLNGGGKSSGGYSLNAVKGIKENREGNSLKTRQSPIG